MMGSDAERMAMDQAASRQAGPAVLGDVSAEAREIMYSV